MNYSHKWMTEMQAIDRRRMQSAGERAMWAKIERRHGYGAGVAGSVLDVIRGTVQIVGACMIVLWVLAHV